jgi:glutaredoxin-related protein
MMLNSIPHLDIQVIEMDDSHHTGWQAQVADLAMIPERQAFPESVQGNNTKSVPQIFIHGKYVGGADDLTDLYTDGRLATLLNRTTSLS